MIKILGTPKRLCIEYDDGEYVVVCQHEKFNTEWYRGKYADCLSYIRSKSAREDYATYVAYNKMVNERVVQRIMKM